MPHRETVLYQENDGVALITLNRPQPLNALNMDMLQRLLGLLDQAQANDSVKALVITGTGDIAFSAGADIKFLNQATPLAVRSFAQMAIAVNHKIETLGKVVIAAINGYCFGGGLEMAEACMIRVAARPAKLGHPEVRIGAIAGFGGTTRLARLVGRGRAAELLLRGRTITAEEALQIGLVQSVVDPGKLLAETEAMTRDIVAQSPLAVRLTWEALHRGLNMTLEESTLLGADYFGLIASTDDFRIGTKRSLKRKTRHSPADDCDSDSSKPSKSCYSEFCHFSRADGHRTGQKVAANLPFGADHGQTGRNLITSCLPTTRPKHP